MHDLLLQLTALTYLKLYIIYEIHLLVSRLNNIPSCSRFIHKQDAKDGASIEARGVCDERFDKT